MAGLLSIMSPTVHGRGLYEVKTAALVSILPPSWHATCVSKLRHDRVITQHADDHHSEPVSCAMRRLFHVAILALVTALFGAIPAQSQKVAASVSAGTNGVGIGAITPITQKLNGRLQASFFGVAFAGDQDFDDVDLAYDASGKLLFVSGLLDWHPLANALRLSGGLFINGSGGNGTLRPTGLVELGTHSFTPAEVGHISPRLSFNRIAPYLGLGIGNPISKRVSFMMDLGAMYVGSPRVEIDATGMLSPMSQEAPQIQENLRWIKFYPVLSMGISARLH